MFCCRLIFDEMRLDLLIELIDVFYLLEEQDFLKLIIEDFVELDDFIDFDGVFNVDDLLEFNNLLDLEVLVDDSYVFVFINYLYFLIFEFY